MGGVAHIGNADAAADSRQRVRCALLPACILSSLPPRSSRKAFTPPEHWLMTSTFDLASFVQTAIVENNSVDANGGNANLPAQPVNADSDDEDDYAFARPQRRQAPRAAIVSRREMAFISPRLGVLNNSASRARSG